MNQLLTPEGLGGLVFLAVSAATIIGALIAVNAKALIRAVTGLCLSLIGVAGLYYFLNSPFLAAMEILIYVGAVGVAIAFAVMLAEPEQEKKPGKAVGLGPFFGFIGGAMLCWGLVIVGLRTDWPAAATKINDGSMLAVGKSLLTTYSMVFELISVVLLIAIIGSLALGMRGRD
jgi:NADH-quinone oxidoreductase subunit J